MIALRGRLLTPQRVDVGLAARCLMDLLGYEVTGTKRDARAMVGAALIGEALIRYIKAGSGG